MLFPQGVSSPPSNKMERDFPDIAANSTFSALERASKIPTAPETSRSVLQHSKSHPRMLESNATSHVWPLGALAELLDK